MLAACLREYNVNNHFLNTEFPRIYEIAPTAAIYPQARDARAYLELQLESGTEFGISEPDSAQYWY